MTDRSLFANMRPSIRPTETSLIRIDIVLYKSSTSYCVMSSASCLFGLEVTSSSPSWQMSSMLFERWPVQ